MPLYRIFIGIKIKTGRRFSFFLRPTWPPQVKIETFGISHKCFREVSSEVYEISQLKHL